MGRIGIDKEETQRRGLPGKVWAQSCVGPMVRMGAGNGRLGGLRALAAEWKWESWNRDSALKPKGGRRGPGSGGAGRPECVATVDPRGRLPAHAAGGAGRGRCGGGAT